MSRSRANERPPERPRTSLHDERKPLPASRILLARRAEAPSDVPRLFARRAAATPDVPRPVAPAPAGRGGLSTRLGRLRRQLTGRPSCRPSRAHGSPSNGDWHPRARGGPARRWGEVSGSRSCPPGFVVHSSGVRRASASKSRRARGTPRARENANTTVDAAKRGRYADLDSGGAAVPMLRPRELRRLFAPPRSACSTTGATGPNRAFTGPTGTIRRGGALTFPFASDGGPARGGDHERDPSDHNAVGPLGLCAAGLSAGSIKRASMAIADQPFGADGGCS